MSRLPFCLGWFALTACTFEPPAANRPIDTHFGSEGLVILDDVVADGADEYARSLVMLPGGGVGVALLSAQGTEIDSAIVRLSRVGDVTGTSIFQTDAADYFEALVADETGAIYAAGASVLSDAEAALPIQKYRLDGKLDPTFGSNGQVVLRALVPQCAEAARAYQVAFGMAFDREARLLISGNASESTCVDRDMIVARLDRATGALDQTFGTEGVLSAAAPITGGTEERSDNGQDVLALANGKIMVVGNTNPTADAGNAEAVLWIAGDDGAMQVAHVFNDLDRSGSGSDSFRAVTSDGRGGALALGRSFNGTDLDLVVARFDEAGDLDATFADGGVFVFDSGGDDRPKGGAVDAQGRIWIIGSIEEGTVEDIALWRLASDGSADETWGEAGLMRIDLGKKERGESIAFDVADRAFVSGSAEQEDGTFAVIVLRLEP